MDSIVVEVKEVYNLVEEEVAEVNRAMVIESFDFYHYCSHIVCTDTYIKYVYTSYDVYLFIMKKGLNDDYTLLTERNLFNLKSA